MKMPPLLLGCAWLFWGWQIELPWLGVLCAALLEAPRLVSWRWELPAATARGLARICQVIVMGLAAYTVFRMVSSDPTLAILFLAAALPIPVLPMILAQMWSEEGGMDLRLFYARGITTGAPLRRDLSWPVWCLCLLAAVAKPGMQESLWPAVAAGGMLTWGLWARRRAGAVSWRWALLMLAALGLGISTAYGLRQLQGQVEEHFGEWFSGMESGGESDPSRSNTAIGRIGKLKLSEQIMFRVYPSGALQTPLLLRDASYRTYQSNSWLAGPQQFQPVLKDAKGVWHLGEMMAPQLNIHITHALKNGEGLLSLPPGATSITGLGQGALEQGSLGTVLLRGGGSRLAYQVSYDAAGARGALPDALDLQVPRQLSPLLNARVAELRLAGKSAEDASAILLRYFQDNYRYSLVQGESGGAPLVHFLRDSHAGHCEFFATATVLLLRSAGIPARYATGYSVQEYSAWERAYVVRARHAHAWTQVYANGAWHDLDTTPSRWAEFEAKTTPVWQNVADRFNWVLDRIQAWVDNGGLGWMMAKAKWLVLMLLAYFGWRLWRARGSKKARSWPETKYPLSRHGLDSEWFAFEKSLADAGLIRAPAESLKEWAQQVSGHFNHPDAKLWLQDAIDLHYRLRFAAEGLDAIERQRLCACIQQLKAALKTAA